MTGERIPHPSDPDSLEAYDLLILADGPWTEARMRVADGRVVRARHWIEYVRLLSESATQDLERVREELEDKQREHGAKSEQSQKAEFHRQMTRARIRLGEAITQRAAIRTLLFLDEEADQ